MTKRRDQGPAAPAAGSGTRLVWVGFGLAGVLFLAGLAVLLAGRTVPGAVLTVAGILAAACAYLAPAIPWESLRAARPSREIPASAGPASPLRFAAWSVEGFASLWGGGDTWSLNRLALLAPAMLLLAGSAVLALSSTTGAAIAFAAACVILWVYFQNMARPLVLPHVRQNLRALLAQTPALPFQAWGVWLLNFRYDNPAMVWWGFFICAAASGWAYFALKRWPLDLLESGPEPVLGWALPRPFFTAGRLGAMSGLAAAAAVSGVLAEFVFPGDHQMLAVLSAFASMLLLILSFPWFHNGLAFSARFSPAVAAPTALAAALASFALGAHGQDLIERGSTAAGLWFFLAGGVVLVAGLSRFSAEPSKDALRDGPFWSRLEVVAVLALGAVAFGFHLWHVGTFPYAVEGDEGGGGCWATWVLKGTVENHFIHENYPLAFFSVTALFFKIAGIGIATLRWHSVFFGTLSVFTAYFFMRDNMGRGAAFLATLLMTFSYWHLHYSRFGHYNIEQVAVQMVAFYFVFKGLKDGRLWQWAVGGFAFGLAMFPHMAGRLLPFQGIAFLLYLFVFRRDLLRRHLPGLLAFIVLTWAIASPALVYWNRSRGNSLGRIQDVSIFNKNNTNAPIDTLGGFVRNCRVSMLMFNDQADSRPRDNPVAPDRILEHWTAILFALAFLYVLYHWREPVNFFLLSVFFINLCASIFSVEAPQTLRTAGNIPIVFALIAVPMADLGSALRLWRAGFSRLVFLGLLAACVFFSYRSARRLFVDHRDLAFDVAPTYIAKTAGDQGGPDTQAVFWGTGYGSGHPPMQLLTRDTPLRNFYGPFEWLPITQQTDRDQLLFFGDDYEQMVPYMESLYPKAAVRVIPDLRGGQPIAYWFRVDRNMIRDSEGLDGEALVKGRTVPVTGAAASWPQPGLEGARRVRLSGSLNVGSYGTYGLEVSGAGDAWVRLDGKPMFSRRRGSVERRSALLAKGLHSLELELEPASASDVLQLELKGEKLGPQESSWSLRSLGANPVEPDQVLRLPAEGFLGSYYLTRTPQGTPVFQVVEPVMLDNWLDSPFLGSWSARWRTRFYVSQVGAYRFQVRGGVFSEVKVDSKTVWRSGSDPDAVPSGPAADFARLSKGWHEYEAVFSSGGGNPDGELEWTRPDGSGGLFWVPGMKPQY